MPIADPNRIYDGFANLAGGVDDGRLPNLIDKNQCVEADNAIFRGGSPENRPPFIDVPLTFTNPNLTYNADGTFQTQDGSVGDSRNAFQNGILQEASYFAPRSGQEFIMVTAAGRQYQITPANGQAASVYEIELPKRNRNTIQLAYHLQAGIYHITQDTESAPIIFNGVTARRAVKDEILTGRMMGYGQGRIVLVGSDGLIYFGDIRDGKGNGDDDLLGFTETQFLNEGFPSALPGGMGDPTAVQFIPQQDSATGVGECLVLGENGIESFYLSLPRETWKDSAFQHTALIGIGNASHDSVAAINEDIWFRAKDGWRSYRQARAQVNQWGQIPMSTNVSKWINSDTPNLIKFSAAISFNNRLIVTTTPYPNGVRPFNNGLLALDFDILSTFGTLANPAWDGHWGGRTADPGDGLKVTRLVEGMFAGRHRAFMFYIDHEDKNALREIMPQPVGHDTDGAITSRIITRSMDFESPFNEKSVYDGDLWFSNVTEHTDVDVSYRPDQAPDFVPWRSFSLDPIGTPGAITPGMVPTLASRFEPRRSLGKPDNRGESQTKRIMRRHFECQAKIKWSGRARVRKFRAHAQKLVENSKATIP